MSTYGPEERLRPVFDRASRELGALLTDLASSAAGEEHWTRAARRRILADVRTLIADLPPEQEDAFMRELADGVERHIGEPDVTLNASDVVALARPKVGVESGCVGRDGGGVYGEFGGVRVKVCVIGSLDEGIQGGGIEVTVPC